MIKQVSYEQHWIVFHCINISKKHPINLQAKNLLTAGVTKTPVCNTLKIQTTFALEDTIYEEVTNCLKTPQLAS